MARTRATPPKSARASCIFSALNFGAGNRPELSLYASALRCPTAQLVGQLRQVRASLDGGNERDVLAVRSVSVASSVSDADGLDDEQTWWAARASGEVMAAIQSSSGRRIAFSRTYMLQGCWAKLSARGRLRRRAHDWRPGWFAAEGLSAVELPSAVEPIRRLARPPWQDGHGDRARHGRRARWDLVQFVCPLCTRPISRRRFDA